MEQTFLGEYRIIEKIGEGGMGIVYLAHHRDVSEHHVILKELKDPRLAKRFRAEANTLARLRNHPNICQFYHFFREGDSTIIVMEYVEGATLGEIIDSEGVPSLDVAISFAINLLQVLEFAHNKNVFHRDIKPSNIMIDGKGNLKIIDFGIARCEADPTMTVPGTFCGTAQFAAPEQFFPGSKNWALVDIYAVGVILYLMATGRMPFTEESVDEIAEAKRLNDPPPSRSINAEISPDIDRIISKALSKIPAERYQSATEMIDDLQHYRLHRADEIKPSKKRPSDKTIPIQSVRSDPEFEREKDKRDHYEPTGRPSWKIVTAEALGVLIVVFLIYLLVPGMPWRSSDKPPIESNQQGDSTAISGTEKIDGLVSSGFAIVEVSPAADIYLDDSLKASASPLCTLTVEPGNHVVQLVNREARKPTFTDTVTIAAGTYTKINHRFELGRYGKLSLSVDPSADLYINDHLIGRAISKIDTSLAVGDYSLRLVNDSAVESEQQETVQIEADSRVTKSYSFDTLPLTGIVRIGSDPVMGATIEIDGRLQEKMTPAQFVLPAGKHRFRISHADYSKMTDTTFAILRGGNHHLVARFAD